MGLCTTQTFCCWVLQSHSSWTAWHSISRRGSCRFLVGIRVMIRHTLLNRLSINIVLEMIAFRSISSHSDLYPHIQTYIPTIKTFILIFRTCRSTFRPVSSHSNMSPYILTVSSYSDCLLIFRLSPHIQTCFLTFWPIFPELRPLNSYSGHADQHSDLSPHNLTCLLIFRQSPHS